MTVAVSTGSETFDIEATEDWTVRELRQAVARHMGLSHVRLLHGGRLLSSDALSLSRALSQRHAGRAAVLAAAAAAVGRPAETAAPVVGFARLREAGLEEEDIEVLRRQFAEIHGPAVNVEDEERWLADVAAVDRDAAPSRDRCEHETLFFAMLGGFVFPPLALLVHEATSSRHAKAGAAAGAVLNVVPYLLYRCFFA